MSKESWYTCKLSDMDIVRIDISDDWIVDYDKSRGMYRVSYFEDGRFVDECWFDAYEDKEVDNRVEKIIKKLEQHKEMLKEEFWRRKYFDKRAMTTYLNLLIDWIKELK